MNWQLLFILIGAYVVLFFVLNTLTWPGIWYLRRRFHAEFGCDLSDENIALLDPERQARWEAISSIHGGEYSRTFYRTLEGCYLFFHYPSIILLSAVLGRNPLPAWQMFLVTGITYVTIAYFKWR